MMVFGGHAHLVGDWAACSQMEGQNVSFILCIYKKKKTGMGGDWPLREPHAFNPCCLWFRTLSLPSVLLTGEMRAWDGVAADPTHSFQ